MDYQNFQMNPDYYPISQSWDESLGMVVPNYTEDIDWMSEGVQNQLTEMASNLSHSISPQDSYGTVTSGVVQGAGVSAIESGLAGGMDASNSGGYHFQEQMSYSNGPALPPAPIPVPLGPFFAPEAPATGSVFAPEFDEDVSSNNNFPDDNMAGSTISNPAYYLHFGGNSTPVDDTEAGSSPFLAAEDYSSPSVDDNVVRDVLGPNNQDARVQKRGKGKGKAKAPRRAKETTPDRPARAVRAFSCKSCRRKKTKCDGSPGHACSKCQKGGTACEIDGKDGRTNKTILDKYESLRVALNAHLVRVAQICHYFCGYTSEPQDRCLVAAGAAKTLEVFRMRGITIEPWRLQDILWVKDFETHQLPEHRTRLGEIGKLVKEKTMILAKIIEMVTKGDSNLWDHGRRLIHGLFDRNTALEVLDKEIKAVFITDKQDFVYKVLANEVDEIIAQHL
ncbi:hypothetical protein CaCOL14_001048 [Colletotrichum acutatum]|uniref:Zn(2)-C6 fungal-type domain-containing protein n=1 Tax=Glomerella acutata TaxID=27357 RepID=A0AAD8XN17_GLOAC|nr:uncharacterized protein BDZ83DRAFT_646827 [Colletotrichum acutatum]KAK1730472.1 hypothetical protein BDZ83DRAFT_646827 [Colletotrichum acutatum]